ncbi:hypothetical protein FR483_n636R [Paramecium bursaria Chlorella virus FR483]|uniref:Uncharacterized protein n636R n=1 Tax=Paramecium bursaria Chlorella virus FR483 TaxID=399781 RepID=A7J7Z0_PBCVF|nr:hypothetical protein FR483_n636R [Paramecium bursaria Chlorella virus FR483]ABT15921.1 hypothetical protein FR483_n636R [Paramecium bursaria Chlorella virus FR483]
MRRIESSRRKKWRLYNITLLRLIYIFRYTTVQDKVFLHWWRGIYDSLKIIYIHLNHEFQRLLAQHTGLYKRHVNSIPGSYVLRLFERTHE